MPSGGALAGLRVLDVTQVMAGPYCAMLLCDMGADVIKVEPRAGDSTRRMAGAAGGDSPSFNAVNRGKRGIVIDLKSDGGRGVFERLASSADVLIENFRPGVMAGLGLDFATLANVNPRLIYASISGYGQTGPKAACGGFDLVAQGVSGIISVTGEPGRPPTKAGIPITDLGAALFATTGILAAVHHRETTGRGQQIDTSLVDAGVAMSVWEATEYFSGTGVPAPLGSAHRMSAPYQAVKCSDGYVTLGGANDRIFRRLCDLLGHAEWADDPGYVDDTARVRNRASLAKKIEAITVTEPCAHWLATFDAHDIPCGPINNYAAVVDDPQVQAREMVVETEHPTLGTIRTLGSPLKLSATPVTTGRPAPLLGQHTDAVLREAGYDDVEIAKLRESKAVK
ncbi:MAG: CoA transferase [Acidobacteria bacterium]|nr:CoA transferase [Acidobacteriota bacterium]